MPFRFSHRNIPNDTNNSDLALLRTNKVTCPPPTRAQHAKEPKGQCSRNLLAELHKTRQYWLTACLNREGFEYFNNRIFKSSTIVYIQKARQACELSITVLSTELRRSGGSRSVSKRNSAGPARAWTRAVRAVEGGGCALITGPGRSCCPNTLTGAAAVRSLKAQGRQPFCRLAGEERFTQQRSIIDHNSKPTATEEVVETLKKLASWNRFKCLRKLVRRSQLKPPRLQRRGWEAEEVRNFTEGGIVQKAVGNKRFHFRCL